MKAMATIFSVFYLFLCILVDYCESKKDIVFVLDRSGSLSQTEVNDAIDFIYNVTSYMNIGADNTQISLVTFSGDVRTEFELGDHSTRTDLLAAINNLKGMSTSGSTYTYNALQHVRDNTLTSSGARSDAERAVVVLTDGVSNDLTATTNMADTLRNTLNAKLFSIGIGNQPDEQELNGIANDPDSYYVHSVSDFIYLCNLIPAIVPKLDSSAAASLAADCPADPDVTTTVATTTEEAATAATTQENSSSNIVWILVAVLGIILLALLLTCLICFLKKKKSRKSEEINETYQQVEFLPTKSVSSKPMFRESSILSNGWTSGMNKDNTLVESSIYNLARESTKSLNSVLYRDNFQFTPSNESTKRF